MESIHREVPQKTDAAPAGIECPFCKNRDSDFSSRTALDKLVRANVRDTASAHITENGYIRHRILEIRALMTTRGTPLANIA